MFAPRADTSFPCFLPKDIFGFQSFRAPSAVAPSVEQIFPLVPGTVLSSHVHTLAMSQRPSVKSRADVQVRIETRR